MDTSREQLIPFSSMPADNDENMMAHLCGNITPPDTYKMLNIPSDVRHHPPMTILAAVSNTIPTHPITSIYNQESKTTRLPHSTSNMNATNYHCSSSIEVGHHPTMQTSAVVSNNFANSTSNMNTSNYHRSDSILFSFLTTPQQSQGSSYMQPTAQHYHYSGNFPSSSLTASQQSVQDTNAQCASYSQQYLAMAEPVLQVAGSHSHLSFFQPFEPQAINYHLQLYPSSLQPQKDFLPHPDQTMLASSPKGMEQTGLQIAMSPQQSKIGFKSQHVGNWNEETDISLPSSQSQATKENRSYDIDPQELIDDFVFFQGTSIPLSVLEANSSTPANSAVEDGLSDLDMSPNNHNNNSKTHTHSLYDVRDKRPFRCEMCSKQYSYKTSFDTHLKIHAKEHPYECKICEARLSSFNRLKHHVNSQHSERRPLFFCEICRDEFYSESRFKVHSLRH